MAKLYTGALLVMSLIMVGCASTAPKEVEPEPSEPQRSETTGAKIIVGEAPEWVAGDIEQYPRLHYMTARAQGTSEQEAVAAAKAKLARLFVIDVEQLNIPLKQATDASGFELNTTHLPDDTKTIASAQAERVMGKIKASEVWHDAAQGAHHALATLARNTGKGYLVKQIQLMDQRTEELVNAARSGEADPLTQAGMMAKAWRVQQLRRDFQASLKRADLTGRGIQPSWSPTTLERDASGLLTTLQIETTGLEGDTNAEQVAYMLRGGLDVAGIKPPVNEPDYTMRGSLDAQVVGEENGWALGGGELKLALVDKVTGEVQGTIVWNVEVPGLDENAAIRRVYEKTEYMLKVKMRNILLEMSMQK